MFLFPIKFSHRDNSGTIFTLLLPARIEMKHKVISEFTFYSLYFSFSKFLFLFLFSFPVCAYVQRGRNLSHTLLVLVLVCRKNFRKNRITTEAKFVEGFQIQHFKKANEIFRISDNLFHFLLSQ